MANIPLSFPNDARAWLLVDALLAGSENDLVVYLAAESASGERFRQAMPVTLKGRLREVVRLPFTAARLWLEPAFEEGQPRLLQPAKVLALPWWRAYVLMGLRVRRYYRQLNAEQRARYGLRWYSPVLGVKDHYRTVSRLRAYGPAPDYAEWRARCSPVNPAGLKALARKARADIFHMVVVLDLRGRKVEMAACNLTLNSLKAQVAASPVSVHVLDGSEQDARVLATLGVLPPDHWILFTCPGVQFQTWMTAWLAHSEATRAGGNIDLIYSDHDVLNGKGERETPYFKPDWSPELAMVTGYMGQAFWMRAMLWQVLWQVPEKGQALEPGQDSGVVPADRTDWGYRLFMQAARRVKGDAIYHIPAILWHAGPQADNGYSWPSRAAVAEQMAHAGVPGSIETDARGYLRVRPAVQGTPLVSIIIPTRNLVSMLRPCVESVLNRSTWQSLEVIVVDNQSNEPDTLAYLTTLRDTPRVRVLSYNYPFNFSAIMNFAAQAARGEMLCLLNNDTEVITPDWLEEMIGRLQQPDVGVVGARLLYGNGCVQHMGDMLGAGSCAQHLHGPISRDNPGYMSRAVLPQDVSAVTGACLLTSKALYQHLGGFDAANLPVAFNDVDFCLRARRAGYRVVVTPYAELFHYESVSRGAENSPEKLARARKELGYMRRTWAEVIDSDPFYNPNLNQSRADFHLGRTRNVVAPWEGR